MLRPPALYSLLFACATLATAQTINVENFNNPGAVGAVKSGTSWVGNVTRNPDAITLTGNARDDNGWESLGQSINATGMNFVTIFGRRDANNLAPFVVLQFEDTQLRTHILSVATSQFSPTVIAPVQIPLGTSTNGFNFAQITGWSIGGGTPPPGTVTMRMTFDHLTLSPTATLSTPTITVQPADRVIGVGTGTILTVAATGSPPLTYQWKRNGTPIDGATTATLAFSNTPLTSADSYQVDVANGVGITPSRIATLAVLDVQPTHALATASAGGYIPGSPVTLTQTITFAGPAPTALGWRLLLPPGWTYASDGGTAPQSKPAANTPSLAEWAWTMIPTTSPVTFTITLNVPGNATGAQSLTAQLLITQNGATGEIFAKSDPLVIPVALRPHSADTTGNYAIDLTELTRVIQLYNVRIGTIRTGAYAVDAANPEDGFAEAPTRASGATVTLTRYHSADVNRDARFSLVELTRVIELFNTRAGNIRTGTYRAQSGTEDGYAPGP